MANEKILNTRIINKHAELITKEGGAKGWDKSTLQLKEGEIALAKVTVAEQHTDGKISEVPAYLVKVGIEGKTFGETAWAYAKAADVYAWAKQQNLPVRVTGAGNAITNVEFGTWEEGTGDSKVTKYGITATNGETFVTSAELETYKETVIDPLLDDYVKSVDKKAGTAIEVDNTDDQNPKVGLKIDTTSSNATGGTAVKLSQSDNGLKAEVDLSEYTKTVDLNVGVTSIITTDDGVVELTPTTKSTGDVTITGAHALKGPANGYTSSNDVTSIGAGESKTIKLPQFTVDAYGHVNAAEDEDVTITIPSLDDYATKEYVDNNEKDTKTTVSAGSYIDVELTTNDGVFTENSTNNYKVSVNESELIALIGAQTTAAMTFCGATAALPTTKKVDGKDVALDNGDMFKTTGAITVAADKDAQGAGFTTKAGDAIVYDGAKWYLIPAGDSAEDTWRTLQVNGTNLPSPNTVNFVDGQAIEVQSSSSGTLTTITFNHANVHCAEEINPSPVDLVHGGLISVVSDITVNSQGHVEGYRQDYYNLPEQYVHPVADVTSTSTNVTLAHGDNFVVKNETFDATGHVKTETTTTYTLPEQYVHPNAANTTTSNATALEHGDSFDVVIESFDAQGHRIGTHTETYTLPELPESIDTAVQTITSNCTAGQETSGLKVTRAENSNSVNIEIDDAVTFIFDCGGAE